MSNTTKPNSVEKKINKVNLKELIYRNEVEPNVSFDVVSGGNNPKDMSLGSLCLMGHVTSKGDEDVNYLTSLLGSLAKREYYSKDSLREDDPRKAFERTLKKLNEVLENFFASDNLTIHVGLIAIANGNLMASRLGKFKVALARDGEYIDVINNIDLFKKEISDSLQFSNIISGPVNNGDKIFAYIPIKSITTREKNIRTAFIQQDQEQFLSKIEQIAQSTESFSCCGVHIEMEEVREPAKVAINIENSSPTMTIEEAIQNRQNNHYGSREDINANYMSTESLQKAQDSNQSDSKITQRIELSSDYPSMIPTEVTYSTKNSSTISTIAKLICVVKNVLPAVRIPGLEKIKFKHVAIPLVAIVLGSIYFLFPNKESVALKDAEAKKTQISELVSTGELKEAKSMLKATLLSIESFNSKKAETTKNDLDSLIKEVEKRDAREPQLFRDFETQLTQNKVTKFSVNGDTIAILTDGDTVALSQVESLKEIGTIKHKPQTWLGAQKKIVSIENKALRIMSLDDKLQIKDSNEISQDIVSPITFGNSLYGISAGSVVKINDALLGGYKISTWSKEPLSQNINSIAIDGSIYTLSSSEGEVKVLFKGSVKSVFKLPFDLSATSSIHTTENGANLFIIDPESKIVYRLSKQSGQLESSSSFESIESPKEYQITEDETLYILDNNNKLHKL